MKTLLERRGVDKSQVLGRGQTKSGLNSAPAAGSDAMVTASADAIRVLNEILPGPFSGDIKPEVANAASNTVLAILAALEHEFIPGCGG